MDTDGIPVPTTTIKVSTATRKGLKALKGKHTYDELFSLMMKLVPEGDDGGKFTPETRFAILEGKLDIAMGRTVPLDEVAREFGL